MLSRRQWLATTGSALGSGLAARAAAECPPTPQNGRGPFYPDEEIPAIVDLTNGGRAGGETLYLFGQIRDADCQSIAGARVEIWQCDPKGQYRHPRARHGELDPEFAYFAHVITGDDGSYFFKTLMPVSYAVFGLTRAPHVHFLVQKRGFGGVATEMQFAGPSFDAIRAKDEVFQRIAASSRDRLIIERKPTSAFPEHAQHFDGEGHCCSFDLILT